MSSINPPPTLTKTGRPARSWRDYALTIGLVVAVLAGLGGMAIATGWQETLAQVSKLTWLEIFGLLALSLVNYFLRSFRWHLFTRCLALGTAFKQDLVHYLGGFAMIVTPGRVGELVRMRWIRRETGVPFAKTAPLVLVDRASDLAAMAIILGVSLVLSTTGIVGALPVTILALLAALASTRPQLLSAAANIGFRLFRRWPRVFARLRGAAKSLSKFSQPGLMLITSALGVAGWFAEVYAFYLLLGWMGADIRLPTAAAIFVFSAIAGSLTGAPGGVGGAEAAMVALLSLEGVPLEISLPATVVIRVTTLWFAIGIGLVIFPVAERLSKKVAHGLE